MSAGGGRMLLRLLRGFFLLVALVLVILPVAARAQASGMVAGQVRMGTTGAVLPEALAVELLFLPNAQGPPQIRTATPDESGAFEFEAVDPSPQHRYLVRVEYAGQTYFSEGAGSNTAEGPFVLGFKEGQSRIEAPLTIYESTSDTSLLQAVNIHYILEESGGLWLAGALYTLANRGDRVIVPESGRGIQIPLPQEAINVAFEDPALQEAATVGGSGVRLQQAVLPGEQEIIVSYQFPYNPPEQQLSLPLGYDVESVIVLVADAGQETAVEGLESNGTREVQGRQFAIFSGANLRGDQSVELRFSNLPPPSPAPETDTTAAPGTGTAAAPGRPNPGLDRLPRWAPLLPVAAVVAALALYLWRRPAPTALEERVALRQRRDSLIQYIADLDDRYEAGGVGPTAYRRQREAAKQELVDLVRRLGTTTEVRPAS
ncbi:MAG TPA: carboxypeptidase-like regulatory domain-containing protein [Ardenticatenaceae bacterium]|nr:carboxypeptidase-like regulatory domain-containing protein [Ardenticatenaceae bacterium]